MKTYDILNAMIKSVQYIISNTPFSKDSDIFSLVFNQTSNTEVLSSAQGERQPPEELVTAPVIKTAMKEILFTTTCVTSVNASRAVRGIAVG